MRESVSIGKAKPKQDMPANVGECLMPLYPFKTGDAMGEGTPCHGGGPAKARLRAVPIGRFRSTSCWAGCHRLFTIFLPYALSFIRASVPSLASLQKVQARMYGLQNRFAHPGFEI